MVGVDPEHVHGSSNFSSNRTRVIKAVGPVWPEHLSNQAQEVSGPGSGRPQEVLHPAVPSRLFFYVFVTLFGSPFVTLGFSEADL